MRKLFSLPICAALFLLAVTAPALAQKQLTAKPAAAAATGVDPVPEVRATGYAYKGISIGMDAAAVRDKLGNPKDKSDPQDLFVFSDEESAQFLYDPNHKVSAIMVTFSGKMTGAPTAKDVFGEDVPAKPDGGVFKMVRYPKSGYWVSYNKIVGDDSIVSIAMQKM